MSQAPENSAEHDGPRAARAYRRHRPEQSLLYRTIARYYPAFRQHCARHGRALPPHVQREFEAYLHCGRLEHGLQRFRCTDCTEERWVPFSCQRRGFCPSCAGSRMVNAARHLTAAVLPPQPYRQWVLSLPYALRYLCATNSKVLAGLLGIAYRTLAAFLIKQAGAHRRNAQCGAVTAIQRAGSALNLNVHFHLLVLDGVFVQRAKGALQFKRVEAPSPQQLHTLVQRIARRMGRWLERRGHLERDGEELHLTDTDAHADEGEAALKDLQAHSIRYLIATGPRRGQRAFRTSNDAFVEDPAEPDLPLARCEGFSLHAAHGLEGREPETLERLCRYLTRPPLAVERLSVNEADTLTYTLKTPWKNGLTEWQFEPFEFIARLAALVPAPRTPLLRYHGVFAPHATARAHITPAARGRRARPTELSATASGRLSWAQRLKHAFALEALHCPRCNGTMRRIGALHDPKIIARLLEHRHRTAAAQAHAPRGPPPGS